MKVVNGFKDFVLRGNVLDLAVAVVIGAAFTNVVTAVVEHLITPLIAAVGGSRTLDTAYQVHLNGAVFGIGAVLGAVVNFLIVAAVVYFLIVTPVNRLLALRAAEKVPAPAAPSEEVRLLTEIRDLLARQGGETSALDAR